MMGNKQQGRRLPRGPAPGVRAARGGAEAGISHHFRWTARGREVALRPILPTEMGQAARNVFPS